MCEYRADPFLCLKTLSVRSFIGDFSKSCGIEAQSRKIKCLNGSNVALPTLKYSKPAIKVNSWNHAEKYFGVSLGPLSTNRTKRHDIYIPNTFLRSFGPCE